MRKLSGGCHCGNIHVEIQLARDPSTYHPRACDCDFCRKHGATYVSDPEGSLTIRINDERNSGSYRQGSGLVECIICRNCGVLIGALYRIDGRIYGAVNTRVIADRPNFGPEQPVSPKILPDAEKIKRWLEIWFQSISITSADG